MTAKPRPPRLGLRANFGQFGLRIANRGYVLEGGEVVLQGSGEELLNHQRVAAAYLGVPS